MKEQGKQDDIRREGRQGAKTLSAHTVERTMCRARAVLAFSDEYDLSGRANMGLGETVTSERNRASEVHQLTTSKSPKGREMGSGGIGRV
jgi:hypothetical protein